MKANIYWFKKDLRLFDNEALNIACKSDLPLILIYVYEPEMWAQDDASFRHLIFLNQCLQDLQKSCQEKQIFLNIFHGKIDDILSSLNNKFEIKNLYSHQETGNFWSFQRDLKVKKFCQQNLILWHEVSQNGVIRNLKDRDAWSAKWQIKMSQEILQYPKKINSLKVSNNNLITPEILNLKYDGIENAQIGGRKNALDILNDFINLRGENYTKEMSSPVTAFESCSRISPYLTFGSLSIKEVFQIASKRKQEIKSMSKSEKGGWPSALNSFLGRLRWHCHFIQKLEDEPRIEFENLHPNYDILDRNINERFFQSWKEGKTGFPMIDSSMRALIKNGWINFRMRAMLVSFASNHLWLDWRVTSKYLAKLFIDYEPGIHYSQIQMQSGTTGINAIRIYNPTKQALDQDPNGIFIRKYIPELKNISDKNIANPSQEPLLMANYPMPIIDEKKQHKIAADKLYKIRKNQNYKNESIKILKKHGSRKSRVNKGLKINS